MSGCAYEHTHETRKDKCPACGHNPEATSMLMRHLNSTNATLGDELRSENREWLMGYGLPVQNLIGAFDKRGREINHLRGLLQHVLDCDGMIAPGAFRNEVEKALKGHRKGK